MVIIGVTFAGELLKYILPLPIPASIYGMALMFAGLMSGAIKLDSVKDAGKFLIEIMPVMFIPAGVGLLESWGVLQPLIVPVTIITVVTIVTVMAAAGLSSQWVIRHSKKGNSKREAQVK